MTAAELKLLEASVARIVELELTDGTQLIATPLFVYTGEENPDVFVLPADGGAARSILLTDIVGVRGASG